MLSAAKHLGGGCARLALSDAEILPFAAAQGKRGAQDDEAESASFHERTL
jgi:hypothetical protein